MTKILWRRSFQRSRTMCIVIMFLAMATLSGRGGDSYLSLKYQDYEETSFRQLKPSYKWTFMAYLAGDNSLEKDMKRFVNDMERAGSIIGIMGIIVNAIGLFLLFYGPYSLIYYIARI